MDDLTILAARANLIRMKQANEDAPIIIMNGNMDPGSGALTQLGGLGMVGSGVTGLGALGVNRAANWGQRRVQQMDPYTPEGVASVQRFNEVMGRKMTPERRLLNYVRHGSELMGQPAFRNGATGLDVMRGLRTNPITQSIGSMVAGKDFGWSPEQARHYGEFAKGPGRAYLQLAHEIYGDKADHLLNPVRKQLEQQARTEMLKQQTSIQRRLGLRERDLAGINQARQQAYDQFEQANRGKANTTVQKVEEALRRRGLLAEGQSVWDSKYKDKVQIHHSRLDAQRATALQPHEQQAQRLQQEVDRMRQRLGTVQGTDIGKQVEQRMQQAIGRYGGAAQAGVGMQLEQLARANPQLAKMMGTQGIGALPPEKQLELLKRFTMTDSGRQMAGEFSKKWDGPIAQYRNLGNAMTAPKQMIDQTSSRLGSLAGRAGMVAKGSLPAFALSGLTYMGGKYMDSMRGQAQANNLAQAIVRARQQAAAMRPQMPQQTPGMMPPQMPQGMPMAQARPPIGMPKMSSDDIPPMPGQSATTTVGNLMGFGGGLTALGGGAAKLYGDQALDATGKALVNPATGTVQRSGNWLGSKLGLGNMGDKAWQSAFNRLSKQQQMAVRGSMYGGKAGLAGLGVMGLGLLVGNQGMKSDTNALRQHSETLTDMIRKQRQASPARQIETPQVQKQIAESNVANKTRGILSRGMSSGDGSGARAALAEAATSGTTGVGDMRVHNTRELLRRTGGALKGWWQRMNQVYGGQ